MSRGYKSDSIPERRRETVRRLLDAYGRTFAEELGIKLCPQGPSGLFRLLCAALLFSARIGSGIAVNGAQALAKAGWTTPRKMAGATWEERTRVLNRSGYARYDEKTSRMLADTSQLLIEKYGGDLRKLRSAAERDPMRERELIEECKGIGKVGADIFFREVQVVWDELHPFADDRSLRSARMLGLPDDAEELAKLVPRADFPRLVAALVRVDLKKAHAQIASKE